MLLNSSEKQRTGMMLSLVSVLALATWFYGVRVVVMAGLAVIFSVLLDCICMHLLHFPKEKRNYTSAVITALIIVCCVSPMTPYAVLLFGVTVAIGVAKFPFGGTGKNIFNPAAIGLLFLKISFPHDVFSYPLVLTKVPVFLPGGEELSSIILQESPEAVLMRGGTPNLHKLNVFLANYSGAIGTTVMVLLAACALYLLVKKALSLPLVVSSIVSLCIIAFFFPRASVDGIRSIQLELLSGIFLFALVFMASDPITTPKTLEGRIAFGVALGAGTMASRYLGAGEYAVLFPLLFLNTITPALDKIQDHITWFSSRGRHQILAEQMGVDPSELTMEAVASDADTDASAEEIPPESINVELVFKDDESTEWKEVSLDD